ncbi:hypothetical protein, partial [Janthinobacterium sp. BJB446]|uniref:hypothetical protein n=1 Tax=Janthinobacterium sp. BJB446 TaxID=2048009 RepID=UPI001C558CB8
NRTVKQLCADDSAATSVKVGYRQACYLKQQPRLLFLEKNPIRNGRVFFRLAVCDGEPQTKAGGRPPRALALNLALAVWRV